jgi:hypothetical protein
VLCGENKASKAAATEVSTGGVYMRCIIALTLAFCCTCCKDLGIPPQRQVPEESPRTIQLTIEDVGTTDVWLRVHFTNAPPYAFRIVREGQTVLSISSSPADTLVADEILLPNQTYTYLAYRLSGSSITDSSQSLHVTTLDTTSHEWQWALDTLGVMNSYLLDAAIIAPNDIWVVGELFTEDSLGNLEYPAHNAAHWNGTAWELKRISVMFRGNIITPVLEGVFTYSSTQIWFAGSIPIQGDGTNWAAYDIRAFTGYDTLSVSSCWGLSSSLMWFVGSAGSIVCLNGSTWQRQESGTTLWLSGVWGVSSTEIYATGNQRAFARGVVLKGDGQAWQTMIVSESTDTVGLFHSKLYGAMEGLWVDERKTLYTVGNMMYHYKHGKWDYVRSLPGNSLGGNPNYLYGGYLTDVQGNASNDIFICGQINTLSHFNGKSWVEVGPPYRPLNFDMSWYSVAVRGGTACAVGSLAGRGLVIRLWR